MIKKFIHEYILENWQYKLLALGFAIFFWYVVIGQQKSEITIEIPIEFQNVPENYAIINNPVNKVSILLSGPSPIIKTLTKENLSFPVDLSNVKIGKNEIYLYPHMLSLPKKVNVKLINPAKFVIVIDKIVKKEFPVIPVFTGNVKEGYKISSIEVVPPVAKVTCIASELKKLKVLKTAPIDLKGRNESFEADVPVEINLRFLKSIDPSRVKVKVSIVEDIVEVEFKNIKINIEKSDNLSNYKIKMSPKYVSVKIKINRTMKKIISKNDFQAIVKIDNIKEEKYPVKIISPKNVKIVEYSPQYVSIKFTLTKSRKKK